MYLNSTLRRKIQRYSELHYRNPEDDQDYEQTFEDSEIDDLEFLMKEAFFCHDGKESNFRRIQQEKFIKDAHSASELKVKLNYFSYNDHNLAMEIDNPYNISVNDMEKAMRTMAFEKLKGFHTANAALQKQLSTNSAEMSTEGANTPFAQNQRKEVGCRVRKTMVDLLPSRLLRIRVGGNQSRLPRFRESRERPRIYT
ncbi:hypothetical protein C7M61_003780 [Candidozyma pseudohaemuli]|uniref:Uncharacterized protein n=1 Tax=Candidozyma pseudohaemuli TaxID=418784 RepID=A0A2P7YLV1_9ASCO|nr:hypothetical protein C7M61_003780 [[Candida] pseudohaemulonii]PSK36915.1 hypothetical protein C7M61_003780 [[Candida] pseudohaemulonii]